MKPSFEPQIAPEIKPRTQVQTRVWTSDRISGLVTLSSSWSRGSRQRAEGRRPVDGFTVTGWLQEKQRGPYVNWRRGAQDTWYTEHSPEHTRCGSGPPAIWSPVDIPCTRRVDSGSTRGAVLSSGVCKWETNAAHLSPCTYSLAHTWAYVYGRIVSRSAHVCSAVLGYLPVVVLGRNRTYIEMVLVLCSGDVRQRNRDEPGRAAQPAKFHTHISTYRPYIDIVERNPRRMGVSRCLCVHVRSQRISSNFGDGSASSWDKSLVFHNALTALNNFLLFRYNGWYFERFGNSSTTVDALIGSEKSSRHENQLLQFSIYLGRRWWIWTAPIYTLIN